MIHQKNRIRALVLSSSIIALAVTAPALAQEVKVAPGPVDSQESYSPAEIVVTAQKRSERLQDVPVAVSVVSGSMLEAQGGLNLENAQYLVPSMNFSKSGTTLNQSLFLRGVGTSTFSIAGEPSISTIVDGVVYSRAAEAFSDLIDIERMEVLRGPQGTLFGKNASAGVVNIITRRPGDEIAGSAEGGYYFGNGSEYRLRGAIDLPLSDIIRSRLTGFVSIYDGNLRNEAFDNRRVNGYEHWGVRGIIEADPTDALKLTFIADYRKSNDDCCAELIGTSPNNLARLVVPEPMGFDTRRINQNLITHTDEESWGLSLQGDLFLGEHTITSITAYRNYSNNEVRDGDWLDQPYVGLIQLHDLGPQTGTTFSQEFRLTSPSGQLFEYVLGAFYSRAQSDRTFQRDVITCSLPAGSPTPTTLVPCSNPGLTIRNFSGVADFGSVFRNAALFGQATLNFTDRLRIIAGIRYTFDDLNVNHKRVTAVAGPGIRANFDQGVYDEYVRLVGLGTSPISADAQAVKFSNGVPYKTGTSTENLSGKVGAQFDVTPQSTAYLTYARGYKGPAYNVFYNLSGIGTNLIEAETADSFELGLKNTLFNGRVTLNLAAFYARYYNYQANNPEEVAGVVVTRFTNAGTISTRGVEIDALFQPTRDLSFSGGLAYTDAQVDKFNVPVGSNPADVIPSGTQLGAAIKWKGSLAGDYRLRTGSRLDFGFNAQVSAQSKQGGQNSTDPIVREITTVPPYALVNLSVSVIDSDDRFKLTALVKNLFDRSFGAGGTGGPGGSYRYIIRREADRYFGLTGRISF